MLSRGEWAGSSCMGHYIIYPLNEPHAHTKETDSQTLRMFTHNRLGPLSTLQVHAMSQLPFVPMDTGEQAPTGTMPHLLPGRPGQFLPGTQPPLSSTTHSPKCSHHMCRCHSWSQISVREDARAWLGFNPAADATWRFKNGPSAPPLEKLSNTKSW